MREGEGGRERGKVRRKERGKEEGKGEGGRKGGRRKERGKEEGKGEGEKGRKGRERRCIDACTSSHSLPMTLVYYPCILFLYQRVGRLSM